MNEAAAAALRLENIERRYGGGDTMVEVLNGAELDALARPIGRADRAVRRRQVDAAASRRPLGEARRRRSARRRRRRPRR